MRVASLFLYSHKYLMRHYMNLLESFMLSEGTNYLSMFNDFIGNDDKARATIEKYVSWAKINLKKNDRIVWFLRWVRVELAGKLRHTDSDAEITKVNRRLGTNYARYDLVPVNNLMTNLAHYLSLPIPRYKASSGASKVRRVCCKNSRNSRISGRRPRTSEI